MGSLNFVLSVILVALISIALFLYEDDIQFLRNQIMKRYEIKYRTIPPQEEKDVYLVSSGDLRLSANQQCWPAQEIMENQVKDSLRGLGYRVIRAHEYDPELKHGFISSQRMGMNVFKTIPRDARLIVAESVWQYSHHVLAGLRRHQGPILVLANWSGQHPGLVGALNLVGSLTKMGKPHSFLWSKDFTDDFYITKMKDWLHDGNIKHDLSHVKSFSSGNIPSNVTSIAKDMAIQMIRHGVIIGVFDEGCMGMYNAIIDDELLNNIGIYKERLSQSALVAEMIKVKNREALEVKKWLEAKGMKFLIGKNEMEELTDSQILDQCRMYIAAVRISNDFECDAIGIQYQQGLKDMTPASDLVEGLLNNKERPPVFDREDRKKILYQNEPLPVFNEVDEGAAVDIVITNRILNKLGYDPATTLHDVRYGEWYTGEGIDAFVWVFEISGSAPPSHFIGGYKGASSERQPPMYFPLGGGTLKGISKPGHIVWSRVFVMDNQLHCDMGLAEVVKLPDEETERRWNLTTRQWPIMHAVLKGVSKNQFMARHKANHIQVAYAPSEKEAETMLQLKASMMHSLGLVVHICGVELS